MAYHSNIKRRHFPRHPNGGGLSIPLDDSFWQRTPSGFPGSSWDLYGGFPMPFWGVRGNGEGLAIIVPTDIDTSLDISTSGRPTASGHHLFSKCGQTAGYTVTFVAVEDSPIAAALRYRDILVKAGGRTSPTAKITAVPETEKLIGAVHCYVWGDLRTASGVAQLSKLGISRAWLRYDADGDPMDSAAVAVANKAGYLTGPYDTWDNIQDPATSDTIGSGWEDTDLWPNGAVKTGKASPSQGSKAVATRSARKRSNKPRPSPLRPGTE